MGLRPIPRYKVRRFAPYLSLSGRCAPPLCELWPAKVSRWGLQGLKCNVDKQAFSLFLKNGAAATEPLVQADHWAVQGVDCCPGLDVDRAGTWLMCYQRRVSLAIEHIGRAGYTCRSHLRHFELIRSTPVATN